MSGKRIKSQLTREEAYQDRDEGRDEDVFEPPKQASQETMARRKIAAYKPKIGVTSSSLFSTATGTSNGSAPATGGAFGFLNKSTPANPLITEAPSKIPFSMFSKKNEASASKNCSVIDKALQIKSLNSNFSLSINKSIIANPVADLNPILKKYSDYYSKINQGQIKVKNSLPTSDTSNDNPPTNSATVSSTQENANLDGDGDVVNVDSESDESEDEVKIEGPQFSVKELPKSRDYGFKFGYAPPPDSDEDSEDEVKIEGPKFQLGSQVQIKDAVFSFPKKEESKPESKEEPKKDVPSGHSFTTQENTATSKLESTTSNTNSAPLFKFGSTTAPNTTDLPAKPTSQVTNSTTSNTAPSFQFSSKPTSSFSFGSNTEKKDSPVVPTPSGETKPFSFGITKPTFNSAEKKDTPAVPAPSGEAKPFSFGITKPVSSGSADKKETSSSTFSFGSSNGFSGFGSTTSSTPASSAFSFGSSKPSTTESKANPFNFGSIGSADNGNGNAKSASSFNFSFTAPNAITTQSNKSNTAISSTTDLASGEKVEDNDVKGDFTVHKLTEKVDIKTGEEEEDTKYKKRTKITKTNPDTKVNEAVGLGELKLLQNKTSKKARILVRSDGSGNVLLNIPIVKDVSYELTGKKNNLLIIPEFKSDGQIIRYYAMVKTSEDGQELLKHVQDVQKDMQ